MSNTKETKSVAVTRKKTEPVKKAIPFTTTPVATLCKMYFRGLYEEDGKTKLDSFQLVALNENCPFYRAVYDPVTKVLHIVTKTVQDEVTLVDKLNSNGSPIPKKENGKIITVKERSVLKTAMEVKLTDPFDILDYVAKTAGTFELSDGTLLTDLIAKLEKYTVVNEN